MDGKELDQAQSLEDGQLEGVNGGQWILESRILNDAGDEPLDASFHSAAPGAAPVDGAVLGAAAHRIADDDEGTDGFLPHLPRVWPNSR